MQPVRIEILLNDHVSQGANRARAGVANLSNEAKKAKREMQDFEKATQSMDTTFRKLAGAFAIKELVSKITSARGEIQQLNVAFQTMLGSVTKADELMQQLVKTAAITPFGLQDVANGAKQLLAYGFEAENVNDTLIRLGDIAAGLSVPLNDLVYLYGTTMAQGRLYTQDLNQFTGRGIPMISELAKQFGVAESKVKELVEAGKVGFPEVQKVIKNLTDEGGKFGGLMEEQSKTITGQISNIEDAVFMMFNEIGQQSEGVINTTLSGVSYMIENYERFGRILLALVGTYGVYRTAIMTVVAMKGWATAAEALHYNWLLLVEKAQKMLNATMLSNPYVLVATMLAGVCVAMISMKTETERLKEAEEEYQKQKERTIEAEEEHRRRIEELCSIAGDEAVSTDTRREALNKLELKYPDIFAKYDTEYDKLKNIKQIKEEIAAIDGQESITRPENELTSVNERIVELEAKAATEKVVTYSTTHGTYSQTIGGLTSDEKAELENLRNKRESLQTQVRKDEINAYFADLAGIDNDTLAQQITQRRNLLAQMDLKEASTGRITQGDARLTGAFSREELQFQLNKLTSEQNRRNLTKDSSADWVTAAKKNYEKALTEYNAYISDRTNSVSREDFEKESKRLKDAVEAAKKEYDKVKPSKDKESQQQAKTARKLSQEREKLGQELVELQNENDAAEIDAMKDGLQKKLRQLDAEYNARSAKISKLAAEWKNKNLEAGVANVNENGLTEEQQAEIDRANSQNEATRKSETEKIYKELSEQYQSYADKRIAIERQYNEDITALQEARRRAEVAGDEDAAERYSRSIAEATRSKGKALMAHDFEVLQQSPEYIRAFEDLRNTSTDTLQSLVEQLERAKATAAETLNPQDLREYTTTIREIMEELDSRDPFGTLTRRVEELGVAERELAIAEQRLNAVRNGTKITTGLREDGVDANGKPRMVATYLTLEQALEAYTKAKDKHRKANNEYIKAEATAKETVSQLSEAIKGVGNAIGGTAGEVINLIFDVGNFVSNTIDGIKTVQKTGEDAVSAVEKASVILSLISTAITLLKKISELGNNAFAQYEAYAEKIKDINALTDATNEYRLAVLGARQEEERWFAEDGLGNLKAWKEYHDEVYKAYVDKACEAQAIYRNKSGGGWLTGALNWVMGNLSALSWWDEWRDIWGQGGYQEGTTAAINNLRIETRKKSSGFLGSGIGGHSQKTEDLTEWARKNGLGELFDDKGLINKELAQSLIDNYGSKLVGQTKETLEALIELREKYDEYIEKLHEYVSSMYEPLVDNFVDSLWDWLDNGKDALDSFKEYASGTFRDIVSDMLRTIVLEKVVGTYSDDISALYEKYAEGSITEEALMQGVAKLTEGLIDRYGTNLPTIEDILENVSEMLSGAGIDIKNSDTTTQSGKAGGFTAMSQDQGTKLEGLFTSVQGHVANIDITIENVIDKMNSAESYLAKIADNTKSNAQSAEEIKEMVSKLVRDGIKTR